ncbi:MAG TPA: 50S ribosomal protein L3, partial [Candidatus Limnocylindria bacterium]|nr:50S ribosomal protein L3 [Candidatus Limnocylindria bacterium]
MATKGLLARKIGMTQVFSDTGELLPVTVLEAGPCIVVARRTTAKEGYEAVQLGFGAVKEKQLRQPAAGHFKKAGVAARRHLREIRVPGDSDLAVGQELKVDIFKAGDRVDVTGT